MISRYRRRARLSPAGWRQLSDNAVFVVDQSGVIHLIDRAAPRPPRDHRGDPQADRPGRALAGEVLEFLSRLTAEESATAVYPAGTNPLVLEGYGLERDGLPWGGLVVGRSSPGSQPAVGHAQCGQSGSADQERAPFGPAQPLRRASVGGLPSLRRDADTGPGRCHRQQVQRLDSVASSFAPAPEHAAWAGSRSTWLVCSTTSSSPSPRRRTRPRCS